MASPNRPDIHWRLHCSCHFFPLFSFVSSIFSSHLFVSFDCQILVGSLGAPRTTGRTKHMGMNLAPTLMLKEGIVHYGHLDTQNVLFYGAGWFRIVNSLVCALESPANTYCTGPAHGWKTYGAPCLGFPCPRKKRPHVSLRYLRDFGSNKRFHSSQSRTLTGPLLDTEQASRHIFWPFEVRIAHLIKPSKPTFQASAKIPAHSVAASVIIALVDVNIAHTLPENYARKLLCTKKPWIVCNDVQGRAWLVP